MSFGLTDAEMAALEEDPSVAISFDARCSVCCGPEMDNDDLVICGRCGVHVHVSSAHLGSSSHQSSSDRPLQLTDHCSPLSVAVLGIPLPRCNALTCLPTATLLRSEGHSSVPTAPPQSPHHVPRKHTVVDLRLCSLLLLL